MRKKGGQFVAPTLLPFEIASILRKKEIRKLLTGAEMVGAFHYFQALEIICEHSDELVERALTLSQNFGPKMSVYDASYVALAENQNIPFWTADRHLYNLVKDIYPDFILF
jgi:predicted nucleic acid-binding protein